MGERSSTGRRRGFFDERNPTIVYSLQEPGVRRPDHFGPHRRLFTREPIKVLITGWLLGLVSSTFGIVASGKGDLPVAPVIVVSLSVIFFFVLLFVALGRRTQ